MENLDTITAITTPTSITNNKSSQRITPNREPLKPLQMNTLGHHSKDGETEKPIQKIEKVSDESSDSSLDYGSANEDVAAFDNANHLKIQSPQTDTRKSGTTYLTPKIEIDNSKSNEKTETANSIPKSIAPNIVSEKKQLIFNPLTENFESPDCSLVKDLEDSFTEQLEVGQDPLNTKSNSPSIISNISFQDEGISIIRDNASNAYTSSESGSVESQNSEISKEISKQNISDSIHKTRRESESSIFVIESDVNNITSNSDKNIEIVNECSTKNSELDISNLAKLDLDSGFQVEAIANKITPSIFNAESKESIVLNQSDALSKCQTDQNSSDFEPMDVDDDMSDSLINNEVPEAVSKTANNSFVNNSHMMDYEDMDESMKVVNETVIIEKVDTDDQSKIIENHDSLIQIDINKSDIFTGERLTVCNDQENTDKKQEEKLDTINNDNKESLDKTVEITNHMISGAINENNEYNDKSINNDTLSTEKKSEDQNVSTSINEDKVHENKTESDSTDQHNIQTLDDKYDVLNLNKTDLVNTEVQNVNDVELNKTIEVASEKIAKEQVPSVCDVEANPFQSKSRIMNTPDKDNADQTMIIEKSQNMNISFENFTKPNMTKNISNTNVNDEEINKITEVASEKIAKEQKPSVCDDDANPFQTKSRIMNTPDKDNADQTMIIEKSQNMNVSFENITKPNMTENISNTSVNDEEINKITELASENIDEVNPFCTKSRVMNTPDKNTQNINSGEKLQSVNELKTQIEQPIESPIISNNTDTNLCQNTNNGDSKNEVSYNNDNSENNVDKCEALTNGISNKLDEEIKNNVNMPDVTENENLNGSLVSENINEDVNDEISSATLEEFSPSLSPANESIISNDEDDELNNTIKANVESDPFVTRSKLANSTDRSMPLNESNANMNDIKTPKRELHTPDRNGNDTPNANNITAQNPSSPAIDVNQNTPKDPTKKINRTKNNLTDSQINVAVKSADMNFISPMIKNDKVAQKKLSPMSKSGDLMGLSPVTQLGNNLQTRSNSEQTDWLTGNNGSNNLLDDFEEEFKDPNELFKDPAAFDFLQNCATSSKSGRDFGKESLFVKFDPLVGGGARFALPEGPRHSVPVEQDEFVSPVVSPKVEEDASIASGLAESCSSDSSCTYNSDLGKSASKMSSVEHSVQPQQLPASSNVSSLLPSEKPTQVVTPAISTRHQYTPSTPRSSSSAIAAIDRLISLGSNSPLPPPPPVVVQPKEPEMDPRLLNELQSVRELLAKQEEELRQSNEYAANLQKQLAESATREQSLIDSVNEKNKDHRKMDLVMEEYERTMSALISEREVERRQWAEERVALLRERDEANEHLANMEHSFNDIHAKYEKCKAMIQGYKTNEEILKQTAISNEEASKKQLERYDQLRQHAMSQLEIANQEIETVKRTHQNEITKLQAMLKKAEFQSSSLQETLTQKLKDIEELTAICDELINKVA